MLKYVTNSFKAAVDSLVEQDTLPALLSDGWFQERFRDLTMELKLTSTK